MKKLLSILLTIAALLCGEGAVKGQIAKVLTQVPYSSSGYNLPSGIVVDHLGNIYFSQTSDGQYVIKVDRTGKSSIYVGNNMYDGTTGFTGDGGPATLAELNLPQGLAIDNKDNLYIADCHNGRIRKVDTNGIISTIAGCSSPSYPDDGGPATNAYLNYPISVACDHWGNIFISESGDNRIRKVDTSGIISTIAGSSLSGYSGDGGPAIAASIFVGSALAVDTAGNVYFNDLRIRKIGTDGIISAIAGNGIVGFSGDSGLALNAQIQLSPLTYGGPLVGGLATDRFGNLYISDGYNGRIRKVDATGLITTVMGNVPYYYDDINGSPATSYGIAVGGNIATDNSGNIFGLDPELSTGFEIIFNSNSVGPQIFTGTEQVISLCQGDTDFSINGQLAIFDAPELTETWQSLVPPIHGTLICADTMTSTDSILTPIGISYTPSAGYYGFDSFTVRISNGSKFSDVKILAKVKPTLTSGTIFGDSVVCVDGMKSITIYDSLAVYGGEWSSSRSCYIQTNTDTAFVRFHYEPYTLPAATSIFFSNGCGIATKQITANPIPSLGYPGDPICLGDSVQLYSSGDTLGTWSIPDSLGIITDSGIFIPGANGTDPITFTDVNGCISLMQLKVGIPSLFQDTISICNGFSIDIRLPSAESITSSDPTIVKIYTESGYGDNQIFSLVGTNIGTAIITYTGSCGIVNQVVIINPLPAPIEIPNIICNETTFIAIDSTPGGKWTISEGPAFIDSAGVIIVDSSIESGIEVVYTLPTGCYSERFTNFLNAPTDILTSDTIVCTNSEVTVMSHGSQYINWYCSCSTTNFILVSTPQFVIASNFAAGVDTIRCTNACGSVSRTITVNPNPVAPVLPAMMCAGSSVILTDSTPGGHWSSEFGRISVDSSGIATALAAPGDAVIYTLPTGCYSVSNMTNIANTPPPPITGDSTVCIGYILPFTDSIAGGIWTSSNTAVVTNSLIGLSAGVSIISYQNGCGVATKIATVNPTPAIITSPSTVCIGTTIIATDSMVGGSWSVTGTDSISSTGVFYPLHFGSDNLVYTSSAGCRRFKGISIGSPPTAITGNSFLCGVPSGVSFTYTDSIAGGIWTSGTPAVGTISTTGIFAPVGIGTTLLSYSTSCSSIPATIAVSILPIPVKKDTSLNLCEGADVYVQVIDSAGFWSTTNTNDTLLGHGSTALYEHILGIYPGWDTIVYHDINICGSALDSFMIHVLPNSTAGIINGDSVMCMGNHITLSDLAPGIPSPWYSGNPAVAHFISYDVLSALSTGTTIVTYTGSATLCTYSTKTITVIDTLLPIPTFSGIDSLCAGSTTTFSAPVTGGIWSVANVLNASIDLSGIATGISAGTDSIFYSVSNACGTTRAFQVLTVNPLPNAGIVIGPDSLCVNTTTTLNDAVSVGQWMSNGHGSIDSTGLFTALQTGIDTITFSYTNSCGTATTHKTIRIDTLPVNISISGNDSVCTGATLTLVASNPGGMWLSINATATVSVGIASAHADGLDTIIYFRSNYCGADSAFHRIKIISVPVAGNIIGADSICVGVATVYTDTAMGGNWTAYNTNALTHTDTLTGIHSGMDTIFYSRTNVCGSDTARKLINILAYPISGTIFGPDMLCLGSGAIMTDSIAGGVWTSVQGAIQFTGDSAYAAIWGSDTILYTVNNMCGLAQSRFPIVVEKPVVPSITGKTIICPNTFDTLLLTPAGGTLGALDTNIAILAGGITQEVHPGFDTFYYSYTNICGTDSALIVIRAFSKEQCDSMDFVRPVQFHSAIPDVFPNPNDGSFTISLPDLYDETSIEITDICGRLILWQEFHDSREIKVRLTGSASGTYMLRISADGQRFYRKVVVE